MSDQTISDLDFGAIARAKRSQQSFRLKLIGSMTGVSIAVLLASVAIYPILPREYRATANILIQPTNQEGATTWDQSQREALDDNALTTKADVLKSLPLQQIVIRKNNLLADKDFNHNLDPNIFRRTLASLEFLSPWLPPRRSDENAVLATLTKSLTVTREHKSYLLQVGYESLDPQKAVALTNTLITAFVADQLGRKDMSHRDILKQLSQRVVNLEGEYHEAELAEHNFVVQSGLINVGLKRSWDEQVTVLSKAIADAHTRTVQAINLAAMLNAQKGDLSNTSEVQNSAMLQRLRERYLQMLSGAGTGQTGPSGMTQGVGNLMHSVIEAETLKLVKVAQNDADVATQNEIGLRAELALLNAELSKWELDSRRRDDLHRAVVTQSDALKTANQRYATEAGRGDALQSDVDIIALAVAPNLPVSPNPLMYVAGTIGLLVTLNGLLLLPTLLRMQRRAG